MSARLLVPGGRNTYYVSQGIELGKILLHVRWPGEDLASLLVRGTIPCGSTEVRIDRWRKQVRQENVVDFDLTQLPYGEFTARLIVVQRDTNKLAGQVRMPFRKLPYRGSEVCLSTTGWMLAGRARTLPLVAGLLAEPPEWTALADAGFDVAVLPTHKLPQSMPAGLRLVPSLAPDSTEAIAQANNHSALFAWRTSTPLSPTEFSRFVERCPYHPLVATVAASRAKTPVSADIVCVTPDAPAKGKTLDFASWGKAIATLTARQRCAWAAAPAGVSPATLRMAAYLGLTSGAKGIVCPVDGAAGRSTGWARLQAVTRELAAVREVFLSGSEPQPLDVQPAGALHTTLVRHKGRTYVFLINPGPKPAKVVARIEALEPGRTLWAIGEERTVSLDADGALHDQVPAATAHVYTTRPGG